MSFFGLFKSKDDQRNVSDLPAIVTRGLKTQFTVPEPTKSLLWLTNEDPLKISSPFSIKLTISIASDGVKSDIDDGHNFFGEPSLIWTQLPVTENDDLEAKPMYYPAYSALSPAHRYQYLMWLRDVTQQTNLSYVFLYYYGLERHLLVGNFDAAALETIRLLKHHDRGSFRVYVRDALIVAALHHKRTDLFEKYPFILDGATNETLLLRKKLGRKVTGKDLIELAPTFGFYNRRYIRLRPAEFELELESLLAEYAAKRGPLLDVVPEIEMQYEERCVFANASLPNSVRTVKVPQLVTDDRFKKASLALLSEAHENLKQQGLKKKRTSNER